MGYERILVPTDGSENATAATDEAVELAAQQGATVHALYVVNTGALPSPEPQFRDEYVEEGEQIGRDAVAAVAEAGEAAGVDVTTAVVRGTPYEEILDYAEANGIDLVVMGTHGRSGLSHMLLGSVAERVIRHADVPILIVRTPSD